MAKNTTNFNLFKPELTDAADITKMNGNWDKIDSELGTLVGHGIGSIAKDISHGNLLDTLTSAEGGLYMGIDVTNAPDTNWWFYIVVTHNTNWATVLALSFTGNNHKMYIGQYTDGVWAGWLQFASIHDVSGKADASDITTINNNLNLKAPLASPTFTGTPKAPTASSGTNTTQIATTAFVMNEVKDKVTQTTMNNAIETAVAPTLRVVRPTIGNLAEGSIIQIAEEGTLVDFCVAKHNYEGTGRTLVVRKERSSSVASFSNVSTSNKYESAKLDTFLNETYLTRLDSKVQAAITEVPIKVTGKQSSSVYTINRKIFALSITEYGLSASGAATLGSALPVASAILPEKSSNGNSTWSRTAKYSSADAAFVVNKTDGALSGGVTNSQYYQPAFTLPTDYAYSDETTFVANGEVLDLGGAKVVYGTYTGDGVTTKTLTFSGKPVFVSIYRGGNYGYYGLPNMIRPFTTAYQVGLSVGNNSGITLTWGDTTLKITDTSQSSYYHFNSSSNTHYYFAILE